MYGWLESAQFEFVIKHFLGPVLGLRPTTLRTGLQQVTELTHGTRWEAVREYIFHLIGNLRYILNTFKGGLKSVSLYSKFVKHVYQQ